MSADDPLALMTDAALVRAYLGRDGFDASIRSRVEAELRLRAISVDAFADHVYVRDDETESSCTLAEALERADDLALWSSREWTNALDERLIIQREPGDFVVHRYDDAGYAESARTAAPQAVLDPFLRLDNVELPDAFDAHAWVTVDATPSATFLRRLVAEFADRGVASFVVPPDEEAGRTSYDLKVPADRTRDAETILSEMYARIEALQQHAESLAETDDRATELETYDLLRDLVPGKPAVAYNRASVLYELDRKQEAVDGFLEALSLGIPERKKQTFTGRAPSLFQVVSQTTRGAAVPDYFEDIRAFLLKLEADLTDHVPLLHGLATLARLSGDIDGALGYYARILDVEPDDEVARTGVAFLTAETEPS